MGSQAGLRKHRYEQHLWRWWNFSWALSNPKRWHCESAALNMPANLENSAVDRELEKVNFHSKHKEQQSWRILKLPHGTIALNSHTHKVMLKILQAINSMSTMNFQMFKLDLEKAAEPEAKFPALAGPSKKQESSRKTFTSALLTMPKTLTVWTKTNWKILRDGNTRPPDLPLEKCICRSGSTC